MTTPSHRLGRPFALAALAVSVMALAACAREKGEGQLAWLQGSMESEFPDQKSPIALDTKAPATGKDVAPLPPAPSSPSGRWSAQAPASELTEPLVPAAAAPVTVAPTADPSDEGTVRIVGTGAKAPLVAVGVAAPATDGDPGTKAQRDLALDHALGLVRSRELDRAVTELSSFVARWPDESGAEAALDALGGCYLAKGELTAAADTYGEALHRFPHGAKAPDVLYGMGEAARRLGHGEAAKGYFDRLALEYPKSEASRRIPRELSAHAGP